MVRGLDMYRILIFIIFIFTSILPCYGRGAVHVNGYFRKNGTYVQPHYRSAPDGNFYNNWSTEGNINPYTGEEGHKKYPSFTPHTSPSINTLNGTIPSTAYRQQTDSITTYLERQKNVDRNRATYWKKQGYDFDPEYMTAFMMDQKVSDIKRSIYWKKEGYTFDPDYMTAFMMDQKVSDIKRANYWKAKGYTFDPDYMTAFMMDQKVNDIKRAAYWEKRGLVFDPDYMTAFMMDYEASQRGFK